MCKQCSEDFPIFQEDQEFYDAISPSYNGEKYRIPRPTLCPKCRKQRRLGRVNELKLYKNICAGCWTGTVSRFYSESEYKNYCNKCWSSDSWDARDYGREIDFSRSFFEQVDELQKEVPFQNLIGSLSNIENNAVYTNNTADIHNSYMVSESDFVEDCYYGRLLKNSEHLYDCFACSNSKYCYECTESDDLYKCQYVSRSSNCSESMYLENCMNCSYCYGCINLENKKYYILNKEYSREEYFQKIQEVSPEEIEELCKRERKEKIDIIGSENCSGSMIRNSKNCHDSHRVLECQDCRYCDEINYSEDLMDISSYGSKSFLMYEGQWVWRYSHNVLFCSTIGRWENLLYCIDTKKSQDCFGCVNMKFSRYCILNKEYSKEEYETLVPKVIDLMKRHGEWGEFFPLWMSPFGYNETLAGEILPMTRDEALEKWYTWSDYQSPAPKVDKIIPAHKIPKDISEIPDDILHWAIECETTKKLFRIIEPELEFCRKNDIPIPKKHPDQRRIERMRQ